MYKEYKYYTTGAFYKAGKKLIENNEFFVISTKTLFSLHKNRHIYKDLLDQLKQYKNYEVVIYYKNFKDLLDKNVYMPKSEKSELACALYYDKHIHPDETIYVSDNFGMSQVANVYFGEDSIEII